MRRTQAFLEVCRRLPQGHWHCRHGHVADCPEPNTCPPLVADDGPLAFVVLAGKICWIYPSERIASLNLRVLQNGGVETVTYRRGLNGLQVDLLLASLPDYIDVEDLR